MAGEPRKRTRAVQAPAVPMIDPPAHRLIRGDCLPAMHLAASRGSMVQAVVSDPPYGLEFMGKGWDKGVPTVEYWRAAYALLPPGGHLIAFSGSRTYHHLATAIEDAGFEIRDQLMWLYGSGFPKGLNVSKAIDKEAGRADERGLYRDDRRPGRGDRQYGGELRGAAAFRYTGER